MIALVAGGTGLVGQALVANLLGDAQVSGVHALARTVPAAAGAGGPSWHDWDWLDAADAPAVDAAFCCLGTTHREAGSREAFAAVDRDLTLRFAERARGMGASRFGLVSSVGAAPGARSHYLRVKGEVEQALDALGFEALHIMRPSLLLGVRGQTRPAEDLAQKLAPALGPALRGPLARYRPVPAQRVAEQLACSVLHGPVGRHVHYPWLPDTPSHRS